MISKIGLYYRTIKHLKPVQIQYQILYSLRDAFRKMTGHSYPFLVPKRGYPLKLKPGIDNPTSLKGRSFTFLNQTHQFEELIDWNFDTYGKLWAYNLNYFDYLNQGSVSCEEGLKLIREFIESIDTNKEGLEPYPISLRGINWIKFLTKYNVSDDTIDASLYAQYRILFDNIEYHISANHLLENSCSLLWAAFYFRDKEFLRKSQKVISTQLHEQILNDGAHYERSPMYHRILLERLLDCLNLLENNSTWKSAPKLESLIQSKLEIMLGWLQRMSFNNGDVPHLNDSTDGIALGKKGLENYADALGVKANDVSLDESGYRKFHEGDFEMLVDAGKIGPDYQPAHAHCDTLSFVLYYKNTPVFIDTAISTYEANNKRLIERGTAAHNTVMYADVEQSEIWKAFRVGHRAKPTIIEESHDFIKASHDGYRHLNITHVREWKISNNGIRIIDKINGKAQKKSTAYFHFNPNLEPIKKTDQIFQLGNLTLSFEGAKSAQLRTWQYPQGYNCFLKGYKLEVIFDQELKTHITHSAK